MSKIEGIVLFGKMGSGKSYIANIFISKSKRFIHYNIGDICTEIASNCLIGGLNSDSLRATSQSIGQKLREIDVNILNKYIYGKIVNHKEINHNTRYIYIVSGGRTFDDLEFWTNMGFVTVAIESHISEGQGHNDEQDCSSKVFNHITEKEARDIVKKNACKIKITNSVNIDVVIDQINALINQYALYLD